MANYNYRSNDYMRRSQCNRPMTVSPVRAEPEYPSCTNESSTECCTSDVLYGLPIAMAYVPWQEWHNLYPLEKSLCRGTIFEELDKPFSGTGGCCK